MEWRKRRWHRTFDLLKIEQEDYIILLLDRAIY